MCLGTFKARALWPFLAILINEFLTATSRFRLFVPFFSSSSFGSKYFDRRGWRDWGSPVLLTGGRIHLLRTKRVLAVPPLKTCRDSAVAMHSGCTLETRNQFPWNLNVFSFSLYSAISWDAASCSRRCRGYQTRAVYKSGSGGRAGRFVPRLQAPITAFAADYFPPFVFNSGVVVAGRNVYGIIEKKERNLRHSYFRRLPCS